ncbi:Hypothetical predicted protein [Paramuricea clavata]|uniref:Uncharacterized protein n=1 Tax=Paramuricea clavata TaxID=317549 RepID=A0A6S7GUP5_PARCT|nr:Hypothetical predicted protein [Paramuricea clavata]
MSEVVTGVMKLTFGFLAKKIRSEIAERLKDGDVTDEECRRLIVRELDDIKSKLDGLARSSLLSSLCFLQDGVNRLYQSLLQVDSSENTAESTEIATLVEAASFRDTGPDSPINEVIALINAIKLLKIRSKERFKSAIKSFELAGENATKAFCNEALSIEDRIQASQVRMMARILENLEDPEASASDCLQYLKQLHDIGAIREIFSVLINGGMKSRFNKTKRLNNASSVQVMNQILFEFVRKFTKSSLLTSMFAWPTILLGEKTYRLVFGEERHIEELKGSGMQVMSLDSDFTFGDEIYSGYHSVVNSKKDIVAVTWDERTFKVFKRSSAESRILCETPMEERASKCCVTAMDIDAENNLYVITRFKKINDESWSFKLFIFDENGNKKLECSLPFHQRLLKGVRMAVNKDGKIAILNREENILYIGDVCVELNSFKVDKSFFLRELSICNHVRFSSFDGTIIAASWENVYIYTENGELQHKIEKPTGYGFIDSVAINHVTKRILVTTKRSSWYSLLSFSETGQLQDSLCLGSSEWIRYAQLKSHPNDPVALVGKTVATLLQL